MELLRMECELLTSGSMSEEDGQKLSPLGTTYEWLLLLRLIALSVTSGFSD
jgi:hypothetical protein